MRRTLRVLHVASGDLWAGAEVQAFTLISKLSRLAETEVAAVVMNPGVLVDRLRTVGVSVYVLNERRLDPLRIFQQLRGVLRSWRPDVVHTHREKENILGSIANRLSRNVPCVRTVHGAKEYSGEVCWKDVRHRVIAGVDRWSGRTLQQKIIAVTRELAEKISKEFPAEKVAVIENGVDVEEVRRAFDVAEFRRARPTSAHVGIAGRLAKVKRIDIFLQAAELLVRENPERDWNFHVFGDGPLRPALQDLSEQLSIAGKVIFYGHRSDIATCIGGLDALVICSDHEGLPMISLEAAALGVPTVAHAVGGLVEVIPEEFLVSRHDARGYKDGILQALRENGRDIATRHATTILRRFSAQRNAERIRALYQQVVEERDAKGAGWQRGDRDRGARGGI